MTKNNKAFIEIPRLGVNYRPVKQRLADYGEVEQPLEADQLRQQAERCMDCGIPFCHGCGCPLGAIIPEINELVANERWDDALQLVMARNNFPEFTGRVCPALCEAACTAGLHLDPVMIRQIELAVIEQGFASGKLKPTPPEQRTGKKVAIVGSGPAGLAAADQLNKMGHLVTVYEQRWHAGGLLRYGIPDFKLSKAVVERRVNFMEAEGVVFETGIKIGVDLSGSYLKKKFDAICLCNGCHRPRDLMVPGRELDGIHFALDFLEQQNCRVSGEPFQAAAEIVATNKKVVVIGGGDTGSDCVGVALRQGAASVTQIELLPQPPEQRALSTPWPQWPYQLRASSSHLEGGTRRWNILTESFSGQGRVEQINGSLIEWEFTNGKPISFKKTGTKVSLEADLVLLAMGFVGPESNVLLEQFDLRPDSKGKLAVDDSNMTPLAGVFATGDLVTGPSLIARAIAAGRNLADTVNQWLCSEEQ